MTGQEQPIYYTIHNLDGSQVPGFGRFETLADAQKRVFDRGYGAPYEVKEWYNGEPQVVGSHNTNRYFASPNEDLGIS